MVDMKKTIQNAQKHKQMENMKEIYRHIRQNKELDI